MDKEDLEKYTREDLTKMIKSHNLHIVLLQKEVFVMTEIHSKKCAKELVEKSVGKALSRISKNVLELAKS